MTYTALHEDQAAAGAVFADQAGHRQAVHYGDILREYHAALDSAVLLEASAAGRIWMGDQDRVALLQRLSTNDIAALTPGQGAQTVLTNHNGRIIDLLTVHVFPEELLIITSPQQRNAVFKLFRKNIFFTDKVKLAPAGETLGQFMLYGPESGRLLQGLVDAPVDDLPLHGIAAATLNGISVWIARIKPLGGAGFALYMPAESLPMIWATLVAAGVQPMGQAASDLLRVEAGYGVSEHELSLDYIPLEAGLWDAVSFTKGCYVGQEIIARMESRGRMAKQLRGLKLTGMVDVPRNLAVVGKEAGDLTSVVESPRFGPIGLAYVRTAYLETGTQVGIADSDITGEVVPLPFIQA